MAGFEPSRSLGRTSHARSGWCWFPSPCTSRPESPHSSIGNNSRLRWSRSVWPESSTTGNQGDHNGCVVQETADGGDRDQQSHLGIGQPFALFKQPSGGKLRASGEFHSGDDGEQQSDRDQSPVAKSRDRLGRESAAESSRSDSEPTSRCPGSQSASRSVAAKSQSPKSPAACQPQRSSARLPSFPLVRRSIMESGRVDTAYSRPRSVSNPDLRSREPTLSPSSGLN